jgi:hypothetical protein
MATKILSASTIKKFSNIVLGNYDWTILECKSTSEQTIVEYFKYFNDWGVVTVSDIILTLVAKVRYQCTK